MAVIKKMLNSLALRCAFSAMVGIAVVTAFVALLSLYGATPEPLTKVAVKPLRFPENEQMLKDVTAQLAREGAALSEIEPAAGNAQPAQ